MAPVWQINAVELPRQLFRRTAKLRILTHDLLILRLDCVFEVVGPCRIGGLNNDGFDSLACGLRRYNLGQHIAQPAHFPYMANQRCCPNARSTTASMPPAITRSHATTVRA